MSSKEIYLDNAAITPIDPRVKMVMEPFWGESFGNASSLYRRGRNARHIIESSREDIAKVLNCQSYEIIFTTGGTESNNLAIFGIARSIKALDKDKIPHLITSQIEHHSVLNVFEQLEKEGFKVTYLPVDRDGLIILDELKKAICSETVLVSIMYANNEVGTVQPIQEISEILKQVKNEDGHRVYFHTDACQAAGYLDLEVDKLGVDLLTFNGSKIYGSPGTGVLYKKKGVKILPQLFGGGQENGVRPGTENIAGIAGLSMALKIVQVTKDDENKRLEELRDFLISGLKNKISKIRLNGHPEKRLPGNVNVSILDVEGEAMLLMMDDKKICVSTGSACTSGSLEPSHVLLAMGLSNEAAHGSLRFSMGRETNKYDLVQVLDILPEIVEHLRGFSPLKLDEKHFFRE